MAHRQDVVSVQNLRMGAQVEGWIVRHDTEWPVFIHRVKIIADVPTALNISLLSKH